MPMKMRVLLLKGWPPRSALRVVAAPRGGRRPPWGGPAPAWRASSRRQLFVERVARAAQGPNGLDLRRDGAQLGAQGLDVRVDRAVEAVAGIVPDQLQQLVAREHAARALDQE